ncbi:MAG: FUSC family protein [Terracidiphilus sp.]
MDVRQARQPVAETSLSRVGQSIGFAATLAAACLLSYWLITRILVQAFFVSRDNSLLGGMWSVIATIFVFRQRLNESSRAAISRLLATLLSFVLCLLYFPFFPLSIFGMAVLILIGTILLTLTGRSEHTVTTAITTTVVFVVAKISPGPVWLQPILRLLDTAVGIAVGILAARISALWSIVPPSRAEAVGLSTSIGGSR